MTVAHLLPRFAEPRLLEALAHSPVVLLHGPRQCGKTTLARMVGDPRGYAYVSFDDERFRSSAEVDPIAFVGDLPERVILDEVQRVPGLFTSLKAEVDRRRIPGRFLLTGSANVLLVPRLADSLAGRMEILRLHPLAQCELAEVQPSFLDELFAGSVKAGSFSRLGVNLAERIARGGFPAALARPHQQGSAAWYRDYVEALVQRDILDLARISYLDALPRLLSLAASQTARLLNISELAGTFEISRPTIRDYVNLLERIFLLEHLSPWYENRLSRLVKTPKLHMGDTGVASALMGLDAEALYDDRTAYGQLVETFVYQELRRLVSFRSDDVRFHHFRQDRTEVDIVLERGRRLFGIEVKAGATVTSSDFRGLRRFAQVIGKRFAGGIVLYDGDSVLPFGEGLRAVPFAKLWS